MFSLNMEHKNNLYKYVNIQTKDRISHKGWLKSLDPLTGNMVLVKFDEGKSKVTDTVLIIGSAYNSITVLEEDNENMLQLVHDYFTCKTSLPLKTLPELKEHLVTWIKKHRLPVEECEDDSLLVCECVKINPPYSAEDCLSENIVVLSRITELVEKLPLN